MSAIGGKADIPHDHFVNAGAVYLDWSIALSDVGQ